MNGNGDRQGAPEARIILEGVAKSYQPASPPAVDGLDLRVAQGEIVALLGPSGCGKTTTLRLIVGFEAPDAGRIEVAGQVVAAGSRWVPPEARGVGMVFQDYALFPHLTVAQNVAFGMRRLPREERRRRTEHALRMTEMDGLGARYPHELSGGQQQRVALARALAPGYEVVLLDEPLSSLDADLRVQLRAQLRRLLKEMGRSAVLVTHDQEDAFHVADRVGVLHRGRLEQIGTPEEIYRRPRTRFVADFVGAADFIPGCVDPGGIVTPLGVFPAVPGLAPAQAVEVMVRPEDVVVAPDPEGGAVITDRLFLGADKIYTLEVAGLRLHTNQHVIAPLAVGTRVGVRILPGPTVAFPAEATGAPPPAAAPLDLAPAPQFG
ncbi:MAG: ABC transporter ATP-binding protein [Candidatus Methylomirabilales bacterium]